MRKVRRVIAAAVLAGAGWTASAAVIAGPAAAYCGPEVFTTSSGDSCGNSCTASAQLYERLTKRPAPWLCPM